jgi:SET domain-containing protein
MPRDKKQQMTYAPLPNFLEIRTSKIHGHGLFSKTFIPKGTVLGITHVFHPDFENKYIRTPLGGFYNHSQDPNCETQSVEDFIYLKTIKDVRMNQELTASYRLYNL